MRPTALRPGLVCGTFLVALLFPGAAWRTRAADRREIVERCKAATALVDLGAIGSGTAWCVADKGLFLTNLHVVSEVFADHSATLVLQSGSRNERTVEARIVNSDRENDLALLYAPVKGLTPLPLGAADTLFETMDVTVFGYPFGRYLSFDEGASPSISVVSGRVAALRRVGGKLKAVQIDGAINPGQSGGPVVDEEGNVVAIVVAAIPGSNVGFAIPVDTVHEFLDRPGLLVDAPQVDYLARSTPIDLEIGVVTYDDEATPDAVRVEVRRSATEFETVDAAATSGGFRSTVTPVPDQSASGSLYLGVQSSDSMQWHPVDDALLTVDQHEVRLLEVRKIERRADDISIIIMNDGTKLAGVVGGWENIQSNGAAVPDLPQADRIDVYAVGDVTRLVGLRVTAFQKDDAVAEYVALLPLHGAPTAIDPQIWKEYQQQRSTYETSLAEAEQELAEAVANLPQLVEELGRRHGSPVAWQDPEIVEIKSDGQATFTRQDDGSYYVEGNNPPRDNYHVRFRVPFPPANLTAVRLELIPDKRLPQGGVGRGGWANIVLNEIAVATHPAGGVAARSIPIVRATTDFEQNKQPIHTSIDGNLDTGWAVYEERHQPHAAVFEVQPDPELPADTEFVLHLRQRYGEQHTMGRFRLTVTASDRPLFAEKLPANIEAVLAVPESDRTEEQRSLVRDYVERTDGRIAQLKANVDELRNYPPEIPLVAYQPPDDPYLPQPHDVVIDAWIDGKSTLYVGRDRLVWDHESWQKPGRTDNLGKYVLIDGQKWYPEWQSNSAAVEGADRSAPYYYPVGATVWDVKVLSITDAEGGAENTDRGTVTHEYESSYLKITFDDTGQGAGDYRIRLTRRQFDP